MRAILSIYDLWFGSVAVSRAGLGGVAYVFSLWADRPRMIDRIAGQLSQDDGGSGKTGITGPELSKYVPTYLNASRFIGVLSTL